MLPLALLGFAAPNSRAQPQGAARPGQVPRGVLTTGACHRRLEKHRPTLQFHRFIFPSSFLISPFSFLISSCSLPVY